MVGRVRPARDPPVVYLVICPDPRPIWRSAINVVPHLPPFQYDDVLTRLLRDAVVTRLLPGACGVWGINVRAHDTR